MGAEDEAALARGARAHLAAIDLHALADTDEAVAVPIAWRRPAAVVAYLDVELIGAVPHHHVGLAGVRVFEHVGQVFLDDAVGGEVESTRERDRLAVDVQVNRETGMAHLIQERFEVLEARLRSEFGVLVGAAHRAEQASHLGERRATGLLDTFQRLPVTRPSLWQLMAHRADLEDHHADGVDDDVMELARDPSALLSD